MFFNIKKLGHDIPAHKRNLQRERLVVFSSALAVFRTAMSTFSLARNIAQSDLSEFLLVKFLSNVSNVGKQCLKCPLHFSIIILSEKWSWHHHLVGERSAGAPAWAAPGGASSWVLAAQPGLAPAVQPGASTGGEVRSWPVRPARAGAEACSVGAGQAK
jgi:hypothetical protein